MNDVAAFTLAGLGAVGLYALGSAATEHRQLVQAGGIDLDAAADAYESSVAEDVIAWSATMVMLGILIDQTGQAMDWLAAQ